MKYIGISSIYGILLLIFYAYHPDASVVYAFLFLIMLLQSLQDLRKLEVSDTSMVFLSMLSVSLCMIERYDFWFILEGACAVSGLFYFIYVVSKGTAIGGADIKFIGCCGAFLGFYRSILCLLLACLFALLYGMCQQKNQLPFIPFLSLGVYLTLLLT